MIFPIVTVIVLATIFLLHIAAAPMHNEEVNILNKQTHNQQLYEKLANLLFFLYVIALALYIIL